MEQSLMADESSIVEILDMSGSSEIIRSWLTSQIQNGEGKVLILENGEPVISLHAALCGYDVSIISDFDCSYHILPNLNLLGNNIFQQNMHDKSYDLIIVVDSLSEILSQSINGNNSSNNIQDINFLNKLHGFLKTTGTLLLTIPLGRDVEWDHKKRVYGSARLPILLGKFSVSHNRCWAKDIFNRWQLASEKNVLKKPTSPDFHGIGCYALIPAQTDEGR
ncbi:MAG: DUF268 domain-containing protein [Candidatus Electryonea clarkiae]|nr:DUF268 domain-containing protein [Candidatus Electryonea clarkiae]MDP8287535.1 DUF268 domain-containing protein [Candidatus Electryonea clarkiae]